MSGEVVNEGFNATSERGFVWSLKNTNPSVSDNKINVGYGKGPYTQNLENLSANTTYYYKAFASNEKGTSYGELKTVKTADYVLASLTTEAVSNIAATLATLQGKITDNGGSNLIEKGFCVSKNSNPGLTDIRIKASNNDLGNYAVVLTTLDPQTKYFVRAYAQNLKGTAFGNEVNFTTDNASVPIVRTNDFQEITTNSVRAGLEITSNGGADLTEFGVCLSTNRFPTVLDRKIILGTGNLIGGKMDNIGGLTANTTYYLRGYAINRAGVGYGPEKSFTTNNPVPQNNLKNGLIAYYPFNGNANDASGNANNGNNIGATLTTDRFNTINSSYYFSAINCSPRIEAFVNTNSITNSLTISIWVLKIGNGCSSPRILDFASNPINGPGQIQMMYGYNNSWALGHQKSNGIDLNSSLFPHGQIKWTHLVYTNDGAQARFYQDGILLGLVSNGTGNPVLAKNLTIGRMNHPAFDAFDGKIDDVGIWNRALNADEVKFLYQNNFQP